MVPKVAAKGKSFKGAGLYYLHDKKARTAERVAFTVTENLPTDDPEKALRYMAFTAMRQAELKAASGAAKTGRKLAQSVYTYSLSWHPDEAPTQEQMIEAARETLQVLGLEKHEALFVAHNDEPHQHIHVIVNRVNPENGLAAKLSNDHLELSKWAEGYEKKNGKIFCEQRVENNEKRRQKKFVKDQNSLDVAAFVRWRRDRIKGEHLARRAEEANLSAAHKGQRGFLYDQKELRIARRRQEISEQFRPYWAALYHQERLDRRQLEEARRSAFSRLTYFIKTRNLDRWGGSQMDRRGMLRGALEAVLGRQDFAGALAGRHDAARKTLAASINERSREAIVQENERYRDELEIVRRDQQEETGRLREQHTEQSQQTASEIAQGADIDRYAEETGQTVSEQFRRRVQQNLERARKRREQERKRDTGRERDDD